MSAPRELRRCALASCGAEIPDNVGARTVVRYVPPTPTRGVERRKETLSFCRDEHCGEWWETEGTDGQ